MLKLCTLASGSNGNCTYISDGKTNILIDAGVSARSITRELSMLETAVSEVSAVFVTHEHSDHICGLEVLAKRCPQLRIFASYGTRDQLIYRVPALAERVEAMRTDEAVVLGEISVSAFATPHDTFESFGYRIGCGEKSAVVATDIGHVDEDLLDTITQSDMLLLEANYDEARLLRGRYPQFLKNRILGARGHLSNKECARCVVCAVRRGTQHVMLGHLSAENNTPETAYTEVHSALTMNGIIPGVDVSLRVAPRGKRGELVTVG